MTAWKQHERDTAKDWGCRGRAPVCSQETHGDVFDQEVYIECKKLSPPHYNPLFNLFKDTRKKAEAEGKFPVLSIKQMHFAGRLYTVHSDDMEEACKLYLERNGYVVIREPDYDPFPDIR